MLRSVVMLAVCRSGGVAWPLAKCLLRWPQSTNGSAVPRPWASASVWVAVTLVVPDCICGCLMSFSYFSDLPGKRFAMLCIVVDAVPVAGVDVVVLAAAAVADIVILLLDFRSVVLTTSLYILIYIYIYL